MQQSPFHLTTPVSQIFNVSSFKLFCEEQNYIFDPVHDICSEWFILYVDDILLTITPEIFIKRLHYVLHQLFEYKLSDCQSLSFARQIHVFLFII